MPLSINVGLSRKSSQDFQSAGVSINVTAELDQSLLARPDELQQQVANLYAQAEQALDRQGGAPAQPEQQFAPPTRRQYPVRPNGGYRNGNGNGRSNSGGMSQAQRRAIDAIARRAGADPAYEAEQMIGVPLDQMTIRQASELIDHLKTLVPAGDGR